MAGRFKKADWDRIEAALAADPRKYGMPDGGREESVVLASFNIRKLGRVKNRQRELAFMARFCARCDLVAIQEVQDDLEGLLHLKQKVDERVSSEGEFGLVVSDVTGEVPGESGMAERLAFLYRRSRVRRTEVTSDIAIDRTGVLANFAANEEALTEAWRDFNDKMAAFEKGERRTKPSFELPAFLTFTRSPHVAAFEIPGTGSAAPIAFLAVNAHLLYGKPRERADEFMALVRWLAMRLQDEARMAAPNFILLGDLNLDLDKPGADQKRIEDFIRSMNDDAFGDPDRRRIYFPFIDEHPVAGRIRSNARLNQTYDQIAFFLGRQEKRLPNDLWKAAVEQHTDAFDFGVFNFAELFAEVTEGMPYAQLRQDAARLKAFGKHFEHSVSDHMPIWVRLPRPGFAPPPSV